MAYFNRDQRPPVCYCDACALDALDLATAPDGRPEFGAHFGTGYCWAPRYGAPCHACGAGC